MAVEGGAECKVGRAIIECCAVVELSGLRAEIPVASDEGCVSARLARAGHRACRGVNSARIGNDRRDTTKTIGWKAIATADGAGAEIGGECIVGLGNLGEA